MAVTINMIMFLLKTDMYMLSITRSIVQSKSLCKCSQFYEEIPANNQSLARRKSCITMKLKYWPVLSAVLLVLAFPEYTFSQLKTTQDSPIQISADGKLTYKAAANGDRVPDFSYCGYMLSEVPIPDVPVKVIVPAMKSDATEKIQTAIDYVSSLPLSKQGFRGAVLLEKGTFDLAGGIVIRTSGVVLRGSGSNSDGTMLIGTGIDRETLIRITGVNNLRTEKALQLADTYFPVNSTRLIFNIKHPFKVGDQIIVNRPSTKEWLEKTGTDKIGIHVDYQLTKWEPGDFDQN